jgi:hypothetical protein
MQLPLADNSFATLTAREQKTLERPWAKIPADEIFPAIDEKKFLALYGGNGASRPNILYGRRRGLYCNLD